MSAPIPLRRILTRRGYATWRERRRMSRRPADQHHHHSVGAKMPPSSTSLGDFPRNKGRSLLTQI